MIEKNKILIKKLFLFTGICLLIHFSLLFIFNFIVKKHSQVFLQEELLRKAPFRIQFLVMGDSHSLRGISVSALDSAFNYAMYGENNIHTYYKLKYLLEKNEKQIQFVLLPDDNVTYTSVALDFERNHFYYSPMVDYTELGKERGEIFKLTMEKIQDKYFPYTELRKVILQLLVHREKIQKGEKTIADYTPEENINSAKNFISKRKLPQNQDTLYTTVSLAYLSKMLNLCNAYGIKPVFIKFPESKYFLKAVNDFIGEKRLNHSPADSIIRSFPNSVILDFEKSFIDDDLYFFDSHHLNLKGQEAFTKILKEKLDSLKTAPNQP